ncbi:MAG: D-alanyl-D-alanine carboxypeptidase family protein [Acidobacteria bacterium]|nr:D-alanyl-D-alanine carboxypeptidase family protein [Acidobacteriota bacterium]
MPRRKKRFFVLLALLAVLPLVAAVFALPGGGYDDAPPHAPGSQASQTPGGANAAGDAARKTAGADSAAQAESARLPGAAGATNGSAAASSPADAPALAAPAARQNAALRHGLVWAFGGKQHRGWSLYQPLIARTLETEAAPDSDDFAASVSRWQRAAGLTPTGVLDRETWMRMVATWQSRRLGSSAYPTADQLVTVSASEFYDPARAAELRQVERETYAAYRRLLAAAAADPSLGLKLKPTGELDDSEKFFKIVSAFRSKEYQERLRKLDPAAGRAGLARRSPHFTGRALDLYVGGYDPVSTKDDNRALQTQTPAYRWLVRHAERFGFRPYFFEPWHYEYVGR